VYIPVKSGVPQGSVLGPVFVLIFINDIVDIFGCGLTVKLFADDVNIYAIINDLNDSVLLQEGLDALYAWSDLWQLSLSLQKCSILHLGRNNTHLNYSVNNASLPDVTVVIEVGVLMDNNFACKANHRSSLFFKSFQSRNLQLLFRAFTVFVRPLLDYRSPVWAPVYKTDINLIERVQRRFTKSLPDLKDISYHDRLVILDTADTL